MSRGFHRSSVLDIRSSLEVEGMVRYKYVSWEVVDVAPDVIWVAER